MERNIGAGARSKHRGGGGRGRGPNPLKNPQRGGQEPQGRQHHRREQEFLGVCEVLSIFIHIYPYIFLDMCGFLLACF